MNRVDNDLRGAVVRLEPDSVPLERTADVTRFRVNVIIRKRSSNATLLWRLPDGSAAGNQWTVANGVVASLCVDGERLARTGRFVEVPFYGCSLRESTDRAAAGSQSDRWQISAALRRDLLRPDELWCGLPRSEASSTTCDAKCSHVARFHRVFALTAFKRD